LAPARPITSQATSRRASPLKNESAAYPDCDEIQHNIVQKRRRIRIRYKRNSRYVKHLIRDANGVRKTHAVVDSGDVLVHENPHPNWRGLPLLHELIYFV
jgi:hypothetical protein